VSSHEILLVIGMVYGSVKSIYCYHSKKRNACEMCKKIDMSRLAVYSFL
jgi:hypothetical protein